MRGAAVPLPRRGPPAPVPVVESGAAASRDSSAQARQGYYGAASAAVTVISRSACEISMASLAKARSV